MEDGVRCNVRRLPGISADWFLRQEQEKEVVVGYGWVLGCAQNLGGGQSGVEIECKFKKATMSDHGFLLLFEDEEAGGIGGLPVRLGA